nr:MAG TPA: hypothetical protein [Caudoviricetes sp.]
MRAETKFILVLPSAATIQQSQIVCKCSLNYWIFHFSLLTFHFT